MGERAPLPATGVARAEACAIHDCQAEELGGRRLGSGARPSKSSVGPTANVSLSDTTEAGRRAANTPVGRSAQMLPIMQGELP